LLLFLLTIFFLFLFDNADGWEALPLFFLTFLFPPMKVLIRPCHGLAYPLSLLHSLTRDTIDVAVSSFAVCASPTSPATRPHAEIEYFAFAFLRSPFLLGPSSSTYHGICAHHPLFSPTFLHGRRRVSPGADSSPFSFPLSPNRTHCTSPPQSPVPAPPPLMQQSDTAFFLLPVEK